MLRVMLICVGKLKERFYAEACGEYLKRLSPYCRIEVVELPEEKLPRTPSQGEIDQALEREGAAILGKVPPGGSLVALCIEGGLRSSRELCEMLCAWRHTPAKVLVFVIGGSNGLHPSVKRAAWTLLSMSPMTFPHHLARVMLLEQLYRSFKIEEGSSYHK